MYKYKIYKKMITFFNKYIITDENDEEKYIAKSNMLNRFKLTDTEGEELSVLRRKFNPIIPMYKIQLSGCHDDDIVIKKHFGFDNDYTLSNNWKVTGGLMGFNYCLQDENKNILMGIYKDKKLNNKYIIEFEDNGDEILYISIAVSILFMTYLLKRASHSSRK